MDNTNIIFIAMMIGPIIIGLIYLKTVKSGPRSNHIVTNKIPPQFLKNGSNIENDLKIKQKK
jgi:hypothetical protein